MRWPPDALGTHKPAHNVGCKVSCDPRFTTAGAAYYIRNMAMAEAADTLVLRCELGWEDVREIMAASRLLTLMRRSWLTARVMVAALLAESLLLLRLLVTRPAACRAHPRLLPDELVAGAS